jgi:hypothetical protein
VKRGCRIVALGLALADLVASSPVRAEDGGSDAHLRRGVELRKEHRNEEALAEFQLAYATDPTPIARAQVALAEQALARWPEAEHDLAEALAAADDRWIAANRARLDEAMATIARHLGWLEVTVNVRGAEILLDGRALERTPARVQAGMAVLQVRAPGYVPDIRRIEIAPGSTPAPPTRVDVALAPFVLTPPGSASASASLAATAPVSARDSEPAPRHASRSMLGPVVVGALGLSCLGAGSYFGLRALAHERQRDAHCDALGCDDAGLAADSDARTSATVATVAFASGAALVVAGVTWLLVTRDHSSRGVSFVPVFDPHAAGLVLRGAL